MTNLCLLIGELRLLIFKVITGRYVLIAFNLFGVFVVICVLSPVLCFSSHYSFICFLSVASWICLLPSKLHNFSSAIFDKAGLVDSNSYSLPRSLELEVHCSMLFLLWKFPLRNQLLLWWIFLYMWLMPFLLQLSLSSLCIIYLAV